MLYVHTTIFWTLPLFLFLLYLPFSSAIDLDTASFFLGSNAHFKPPNWCLFVYKYGIIPGQLLFISSVSAYLVSFWKKSAFHWRWPALYVSLTLLIGSGFFAHAILKQFWERPRPKQVVTYGGKYPYRSLLRPYRGHSDRSLRSLPSGHATMGFYFFCLFFLGKRLSCCWLMWSGAAAGLLGGGLLSWARLAQGGHFVSDIIVSLMIMWISAYWLDRLFARKIDSSAICVASNPKGKSRP